MDIEIGNFCKLNKIRFTRYADDMTFSGDFNPGFIFSRIKHIIQKNGFRLNNKKTRVRKTHQQQEVTGIVVNKKMQVPKSYRKSIRQAVYYIEKYGLTGHMEREKINNILYLNHLIGKIQYAISINTKDKEMNFYKKKMIKLFNEINNST